MAAKQKKKYDSDEILEMAVGKTEKDFAADYDDDGEITSADARLAQRAQTAQSDIPSPQYADSYAGMRNELLEKLMNRSEFSYDMDADPLYQQYRSRYTQLGKKAAENVLGKASALTGGYASSYADTAAAQAYYEYLAELGDVSADLSKQAADTYNDKEEALQDRLELVGMLEDSEYDKYRDSVEDSRYVSETQAEELKSKRDFAFKAATNGDFSYLEALGIDTNKLRLDAASELAVLMAKYGDYSGLELLGIDTSVLKAETLTEYAAYMAKYGDYSGLERIGVDTSSLTQPEAIEKIGISIQKNAENAYANGGAAALNEYLEKQVGYGQITQEGKRQIIAVLTGGK